METKETGLMKKKVLMFFRQRCNDDVTESKTFVDYQPKKFIGIDCTFQRTGGAVKNVYRRLHGII